MIGGIHVRVEWEGALSITVVGSIAFGCNDPVLEIKQKEVEGPTSSALSVSPREDTDHDAQRGDRQRSLGTAQVHIQVMLRYEPGWSDPRASVFP